MKILEFTANAEQRRELEGLAYWLDNYYSSAWNGEYYDLERRILRLGRLENAPGLF